MVNPTQQKLNLVSEIRNIVDTEHIPIDKTFPEDAANELARSEVFNKHLYRPNTYLHKWWARRCGTTFRYILKQLVTDPLKKDYYEPGGLEGKIILDPMMGGGTTLHEAIRMGANVIGIDIDPIPVLQTRASLTRSSLKSKELIFSSFFDTLRDELMEYFVTNCPICNGESEIKFVLYGLRRKCGCREMTFVDSFTLRYENDDTTINICPDCGVVTAGDDHKCPVPSGNTETILLTKKDKICTLCEEPFEDIIDIPFPERYRPLVIVGYCMRHGQFFKNTDENDKNTLRNASEATNNIRFGDTKKFSIPRGPKSKDLLKRNISLFPGLFTPRQLLYLYHAKKTISGFGENDRLWLSLLVSTSLEFNSILCGYKGTEKKRPGAVRHVFSHHAYSFPYTSLENNPIFQKPASGNLIRLFRDRIVKANIWGNAPIERKITNGKRHKRTIRGELDNGEKADVFNDLLSGSNKYLILQNDSRKLDIPDNSVDFVVTDPPYFDSVQYSDLSNFFRVWLKYLLPGEADWEYDQSSSAVSEGNGNGSSKYGELLTEIWRECARVLKKDDGRLIFTFHHWNPDAWSELTIALRKAGFILVNRYVVFSENPISVHIRNLKALKHDVILVLKPMDANLAINNDDWLWPHKINTEDSYDFCNDCGTVLGWCLSSATFDEEQIRLSWKSLIGGK